LVLIMTCHHRIIVNFRETQPTHVFSCCLPISRAVGLLLTLAQLGTLSSIRAVRYWTELNVSYPLSGFLKRVQLYIVSDIRLSLSFDIQY
jgi:hypothetical protein